MHAEGQEEAGRRIKSGVTEVEAVVRDIGACTNPALT